MQKHNSYLVVLDKVQETKYQHTKTNQNKILFVILFCSNSAAEMHATPNHFTFGPRGLLPNETHMSLVLLSSWRQNLTVVPFKLLF